MLDREQVLPLISITVGRTWLIQVNASRSDAGQPYTFEGVPLGTDLEEWTSATTTGIFCYNQCIRYGGKLLFGLMICISLFGAPFSRRDVPSPAGGMAVLEFQRRIIVAPERQPQQRGTSYFPAQNSGPELTRDRLEATQ